MIVFYDIQSAGRKLVTKLANSVGIRSQRFKGGTAQGPFFGAVKLTQPADAQCGPAKQIRLKLLPFYPGNANTGLKGDIAIKNIQELRDIIADILHGPADTDIIKGVAQLFLGRELSYYFCLDLA